jgi:hypothetical protein
LLSRLPPAALVLCTEKAAVCSASFGGGGGGTAAAAQALESNHFRYVTAKLGDTGIIVALEQYLFIGVPADELQNPLAIDEDTVRFWARFLPLYYVCIELLTEFIDAERNAESSMKLLPAALYISQLFHYFFACS